jgi:hypothetical protein
MTEDEYDACVNPFDLLAFLQNRGLSGRQLRLWACGCLRLVWSSLSERSRHAVEVAERLANGLIAPGETAEARKDAVAAIAEADGVLGRIAARAAVKALATPEEEWLLDVVWQDVAQVLEGRRLETLPEPFEIPEEILWDDPMTAITMFDRRELKVICDVLRNVVGESFRP